MLGELVFVNGCGIAGLIDQNKKRIISEEVTIACFIYSCKLGSQKRVDNTLKW
jgi:hypothetical protein